MPDPIYEVVSQGARYWFLFLMVLIVWRSYRWLARDRKQRRKRLKLLPDAGFVGELVVVRGNADLAEGIALPVSNEGILGCQRGDDICVPVSGVYPKHVWYSFDDEEGLCVEPYGRHSIEVDGETYTGRRRHAYMTHGSRLVIGDVELRLRMFAGFESAGVSRSPVEEDATLPHPSGVAVPAAPSAIEQAGAQQPGMIAVTPEQLAAFQQMQWMLAWQAMQAQGMPQQGMPTAQSQPGYPAPATGIAPTMPVNAVLSTERGDFLPPPKAPPSGAILSTTDLAQGKPSDSAPLTQAANNEPVPEPPRRHTRATPLPAVERPSPTPVAEPYAQDTILPPLSAAKAIDEPTADVMWNTVREQRPDSDFRRVTGVLSDAAFDAPPMQNATFAPRVTFYPPVQDDEPIQNAQAENQSDDSASDHAQDLDAWPYATYPQSDVRFTDSGYTYPEYVEPDTTDEPYEYADEDEAPRSLYVEPDEAEQAKRMLWDRYLKGGRRR